MIVAALVLLLQEATPPQEAARTFRVPQGFRVELVAAEPQVVSPVAIAFDEDGRMYVAEMRDYPSGPPTGTIRLFDGDRVTVFAERLALPSGVLCWNGGVFVTCAYEILYFKDTDGDGRADQRKTVYTGFGRQNAQHVLNGLQFGLDNWITGSNGLSGGTVGGVTLTRSDFRFKPGTDRFEAVSGNSQFGNTFDDWGRRFIVRHDSHLIHPVIPQRAARRQPHVVLPAVEEAISDHGAIPRLHPVSPRDSVFTTDTDSSCAVTIYRGGAFPAAYQGNAFVCEPVMNLVHRDVLVPRGASFTAKRGDPDREFFASTDLWSRPVNLATGPDGALYVCDMYRRVIEHPDYIPKEIQRKLDLKAGAECGRIYRIVHESAPAPQRPRLGKASTAELVAALDHPNGWWRTTAQRLLVERQDQGAVESLRKAKSPLGRLHELWTLEGLSALTPDDLARALGDPDPGIREHAILLGAPAASRIDDPDPRVRFQAALSIGDDLAAVLRLTLKDAADPWMRAALLTTMGHRPVDWLAALKRDAPEFLEKPAPGALELVRSLAQAVGPQGAAWLREVIGGDPPRAWQREALTCLPALRRAGVPVELPAAWTAAATDASRPVQDRIGAIALLAPADFSALVNPKEPPELQIAAARATATPRILENWASLTGPVRREIVAVLIRRPEGVAAVLERLEKGSMRPVELEAPHRAELLRHPDGAVRNRAKALLAPKGSEEREEVIREITARLATLKGDRARGDKVYQTSCATCHRLAGRGTKVGPDLDGAIGRERAALLVDLLDPNRAMDPSYQVYVVRTTSNETVNGVLASETPAGVTLRRAGGEESTIARRDIAEIKAWPASLMPEGIENNVTAQDFADLLEFLNRPSGR